MRRPYGRRCPCIHGCPVSGDTAGSDPAMFTVEPHGPGARGRGDACVAPTVGVVPAFTVAPCFATPPGRTLRCSPLNRMVRAHGAGGDACVAPCRRYCPCIHGCPVSGDTAGSNPAMFTVEPHGPGARGRGDACVAPTVGVVPAFTVAPCFATPPGRTQRCSPLNRMVRAHGAGGDACVAPCRRCCPCIHGCPVFRDTAGSDPAMFTVEPHGPGARGRGRRMRRPLPSVLSLHSRLPRVSRRRRVGPCDVRR